MFAGGVGGELPVPCSTNPVYGAPKALGRYGFVSYSKFPTEKLRLVGLAAY